MKAYHLIGLNVSLHDILSRKTIDVTADDIQLQYQDYGAMSVAWVDFLHKHEVWKS